MRFFLERLDRSSTDLRALRARICAIGPATRAAIEALHLKVDVMGQEYVAEGLLAAFARHNLAGQRILLPRAAVARDLVPVELARRGAVVDVVEAYRTVLPSGPFAFPPEAGLDHFHQFVYREELRSPCRRHALAGVKVASIGPVTSATARELGIEVAVEASVFTIDGLVEAICGNNTTFQIGGRALAGAALKRRCTEPLGCCYAASWGSIKTYSLLRSSRIT